MQFSAFVASAFCLIGSSMAALQRVTNFGADNAGLQMYIDVPANVVKNPAIVVGLHGCHGSAQSFYGEGVSQQGGSKIIAIYPSSQHDLNCFDPGTKASLTRGGGGDPDTVVAMVNYVVDKYNADPDRVFIVGSSSGAMLGNVLAAIYPDVFAAASLYSGTAAGCMAVPPGTPPNPYDTCALGHLVKTGAQWGDIVRGYNPRYTGSYPRMQIWHGTADTTVVYQNFIEELKEWSNVLGVNFSRNVTNSPQSRYTQMIYGNSNTLVGYSAVGVGHTVPIHLTQAFSWFGL